MSTPSRLGRYPVRRRIGSGAFATVWLAYDDHLDSPVAIKVLAENWTEDQHARQRFIDEGRFLRKVDSPHVVSVYDAGLLGDGRPYLVMSFADQGTLAERLEAGALTTGQAVQVIAQIGAGLHALHERGVLHRDVKPGNVLFRGDERNGTPHLNAMLGDLGLGKTMEMSSRLTMIGGTPSYVAPEQARGEQLDARADQYSLAALAYLLLSGRPPYEHATLRAAADPDPPPPLEGRLPAEAERVLLKALAKDRDERYADVPAFVSALTAALPDHPPEPPPWIAAVGADDSDTSPPVTGAEPTEGIVVGATSTGAAADAGPLLHNRSFRAAGAIALVVGLVAGFVGWQLARTERVVRDADSGIEVTVPEEWAREVDTGKWTPPGSEVGYAALSAGTAVGWNAQDASGHGVFVGLMPGEELPSDVPQHPECEEPRPVEINRSGDDYVEVEFPDCAGGGVTVERIVHVLANQLLWVQVRAPDRGVADDVLDSVVSGL
ncbi:serine/threonine-protein kinase [Nocardioides piscis]|uniref:non-specific serine/threonine protein kinase n=1 Tax=Nocardioides piscis TaxID=2714938 RepID=A0A6G7YE37_9ACTN|nr:serine/threonine-protein kinase [Nocardioides piscis]QIK75065.1 serine/threonine protein kinase [Nocardioides piscis]